MVSPVAAASSATTTHDLTFALETCRRCVVLTKGALFADGASKELLFDEKTMEDGGVEAIGIYA